VSESSQGQGNCNWQIQMSSNKEEPIDARKPVEATAIKPN
jgi:hypothetical protein